MSALRGNNGPRYRHRTETAAPYDTIHVDKLTPIIGAEIAGIDLSQPLDTHQQEELQRALADNLVLFFRDQILTPEQHLAFGQQFGALHIHPAAPHAPHHPELMIIHADEHSPRANGEGWHSDVSCDPEPPMGSILYITTCPPHGGDTLFASMYAAYEALSDRMKTYLVDMVAVHDGEDAYRGTYQNFAHSTALRGGAFQLVGFGALTLLLAQATEAHGGAQLQPFRLLAASHCESLVPCRFRPVLLGTSCRSTDLNRGCQSIGSTLLHGAFLSAHVF